MDQALNSQKTPHTSPLRASYGMSFVSILMKNDRVIKGFYCTRLKGQNWPRVKIRGDALPSYVGSFQYPGSWQYPSLMPPCLHKFCKHNPVWLSESSSNMVLGGLRLIVFCVNWSDCWHLSTKCMYSNLIKDPWTSILYHGMKKTLYHNSICTKMLWYLTNHKAGPSFQSICSNDNIYNRGTMYQKWKYK